MLSSRASLPLKSLAKDMILESKDKTWNDSFTQLHLTVILQYSKMNRKFQLTQKKNYQQFFVRNCIINVLLRYHSMSYKIVIMKSILYNTTILLLNGLTSIPITNPSGFCSFQSGTVQLRNHVGLGCSSFFFLFHTRETKFELIRTIYFVVRNY